MQIHVSPNDGAPIYQQIVNQVRYLAASGRLGSGEQLPPVRKLAEQILVNPNTVAPCLSGTGNGGRDRVPAGLRVVYRREGLSPQPPGTNTNPQRPA